MPPDRPKPRPACGISEAAHARIALEKVKKTRPARLEKVNGEKTTRLEMVDDLLPTDRPSPQDGDLVKMEISNGGLRDSICCSTICRPKRKDDTTDDLELRINWLVIEGLDDALLKIAETALHPKVLTQEEWARQLKKAGEKNTCQITTE